MLNDDSQAPQKRAGQDKMKRRQLFFKKRERGNHTERCRQNKERIVRLSCVHVYVMHMFLNVMAVLSHRLSDGRCCSAVWAGQRRRPDNPHENSLLPSHGGCWSQWRVFSLFLYYWCCIHSGSPPERERERELVLFIFCTLTGMFTLSLDGTKQNCKGAADLKPNVKLSSCVSVISLVFKRSHKAFRRSWAF